MRRLFLTHGEDNGELFEIGGDHKIEPVEQGKESSMKCHTKIILGSVLVFAVVGGAYASQQYREHKEFRKMWSLAMLLERADQNGDKMLTVDEVLSAVNERYQLADIDKNGSVSKAELVSAIEDHAPHEKIKRHAIKILQEPAESEGSQGTPVWIASSFFAFSSSLFLLLLLLL